MTPRDSLFERSERFLTGHLLSSLPATGFQAAVCSVSVGGIVVGTVRGADHECIGLTKSGCSALHHMVDVLAEVPRAEAWALKYMTAENQLWHCLQGPVPSAARAAALLPIRGRRGTFRSSQAHGARGCGS